MSTHPLKRGRERPMPEQRLSPEIALRLGRLHEACGSGRRSFALWLASRMAGPVFWVAPEWTVEKLFPQGFQHLLDPSRLILVAPTKAEDVLWSLEEVLRSGQVPLAIGDLPGLPALTPVRRLHLAAEQGGAVTGRLPMGLILTPGDGGAAGVESRWQMSPRFHRDAHSWELERLRARTAPVKTWAVHYGDKGFTVQSNSLSESDPKNDIEKVE